MTRPLLSATLIARDEEGFLPGCLASLEGVADEVVVTDTGSVDRTVEIARRAGARVFFHRWNGSFAEARNAALEHARGDWILYIDADERVVGGAPPGFRDRLRETDLVALTVRFRPSAGHTRYRENRLFRRHPQIRFRGVMHESHLPALGELLNQGGYRTGNSELAIDHLGYDGPMERKHRRNLPLLEKRLASDPTHVYSWAHLGDTLMGLGRGEEAEAAWLKGLEVVRAKQITSTLDSLPYFALIRAQRGRGADVSPLLEEVWHRFPFHPQVRWLRAQDLMSRGCHEEAAELLRDLAAIDSSDVVSLQVAHDERLFDVWAPESLGLCLFRLERYGESAQWFAKAAAAEPSPERQARLRIAQARARVRSVSGPTTGSPPDTATETGEPHG